VKTPLVVFHSTLYSKGPGRGGLAGWHIDRGYFERHEERHVEEEEGIVGEARGAEFSNETFSLASSVLYVTRREGKAGRRMKRKGGKRGALLRRRVARSEVSMKDAELR
jgi:hypothetical protein